MVKCAGNHPSNHLVLRPTVGYARRALRMRTQEVIHITQDWILTLYSASVSTLSEGIVMAKSNAKAKSSEGTFKLASLWTTGVPARQTAVITAWYLHSAEYYWLYELWMTDIALIFLCQIQVQQSDSVVRQSLCSAWWLEDIVGFLNGLKEVYESA